MKESVTYQAILEEGAIDMAKRIVLRMGNRQFGTPDERTRRVVEDETDLKHLEYLAVRLLEVSSWEELLS